MQFDHRKLSEFQHQITLTIEPSEVQLARQEVIAEIANLISTSSEKNLKTPTHEKNMTSEEIEEKYQLQIQENLRNKLIQTHFISILNELQLSPCAPVQFQAPPVKENQVYQCVGTFEIIPQIKSLNLSGIHFQVPQAQITDTTLENEIQRILLPFSKQEIEKPQTSITNGHAVIFNLEIYENNAGKLKLGQNLQNQSLLVGHHNFRLDLDNEFIGMNYFDKQQRMIDFKMPNLWPIHSLASKNVKIKIQVLKVFKVEVPQLSDEFVQKTFDKNLGAPKNALEFKEFTKKQLLGRIQQENFISAKIQTIEAIIEKNPISLPQSMIAYNKHLLIERKKSEANEIGKYIVPSPQSPEDIELTLTVSRMLRAQLIIDFLAKSNKIQIKDQDIDQHLTMVASANGTSLENIKSKFKNQEAQNQLIYTVLENKVLDLFSATA